jgi:hypothetical protein
MKPIAPVALPARDDVVALVELRQQARDLGGVVLEVGVDRDDRLTNGRVEAGGQGGNRPLERPS